ncbi:efflux RND transporter periplasmic adaptor subunit, partial [candidate division KSB1 bacterium]
VCVLLALFLLVQCGNPNSQDTVTLRVPVTIDIVTRGDIASYISLTGTLLPAEEMQITAEVGGYIMFNDAGMQQPQNGGTVNKDRLLAKIVNEEYELGVRQESKRLAMEQGARDYEEKSKLGEMGGVTPREVEAALRNKIDTELNYRTALIDLEKLNIKAPMEGILADIQSFAEGQRISNGTMIGKVMNFRKVRCELNVTNDNIVNVKFGQEVIVTNFAYENEPFIGRVSKISPTIDPTTRTFNVEVEIDNPDLRLRPGMFVKSDIVINRKSNVIRVPRYLILTRNNRTVVFVVEDEVAKMREITVGLQDSDNAEVIEGLSDGGLLVIRGYETLKDNTKVRVSR